LDISGLDELQKANSNSNPGIQTGPAPTQQPRAVVWIVGARRAGKFLDNSFLPSSDDPSFQMELHPVVIQEW